ncbi:hypothetical protein SEA_PHABULOSO_85 [Gordonia phage Phabuloso]|nr:hypothetical protein SEA_PHABULOSO_85 [Gordonia phage Phabuloso]
MSDIGFGPVGDPPIVNHYPLEDDYGRKTPLVDRRLLEQAHRHASPSWNGNCGPILH